MNVVETKEYKGYTIKIVPDDDPENPVRDWDGLMGEMICWHRNYDLGNKHDFANPQDFLEYVKDNKEVVAYLPLFLYDHSGITMSTGAFHCPWDSGQVGWIYATRKEVREKYGNDIRFTKKMVERVTEDLENTVKVYDDYITGAVYGFIVENSEGEEIDSCWGFYGYDHDKSGLLTMAYEAIECELKGDYPLFDGEVEQYTVAH